MKNSFKYPIKWDIHSLCNTFTHIVFAAAAALICSKICLFKRADTCLVEVLASVMHQCPLWHHLKFWDVEKGKIRGHEESFVFFFSFRGCEKWGHACLSPLWHHTAKQNRMRNILNSQSQDEKLALEANLMTQKGVMSASRISIPARPAWECEWAWWSKQRERERETLPFVLSPFKYTG